MLGRAQMSAHPEVHRRAVQCMFAPGRVPRQIAIMANSKSPKSSTQHSAQELSPSLISHRWLLMALLVATASLAYRALTGAFLINPESSQYVSGYAFREFASQSLRSGNGFPQWNSYMFGGMPYAAALHGDVFYPTFLLRLVLRTDVASTWAVVAHVFLTGFFALGFLRVLGVTTSAALFGAVAYMFSGPLSSVAASGNDGQLFVGALLPLALWMLVRAIRDARIWAWGVFSLTVGLASLSGNTAMLQMLLLASAAFSVWLVWRAANVETETTRHDQIGSVLAKASASREFNTEQRLSRAIAANHSRFFAIQLLMVAGAMLAGLCIGAIQSWPALGYASVSAIAQNHDLSSVRAVSMPPEEMFNIYLPQFTGILTRYWGRSADHQDSLYLGVAVLMFAMLGVGSAARKVFARCWFGAAVLALVWSMGAYTPLFQVVNFVAPALALVRQPEAAVSILALAVCVLSAVGLERVLLHDVSKRALVIFAICWVVFAVLVFLLTSTGALNAVAHEIMQNVAVLHRNGSAFTSAVIGNNDRAQLLGAIRSGGVVLGVVLALLLFKWRRLPLAAFAFIVVAISAADLWSIAHLYWKFSEPAKQLYESDAVFAYLSKQKQPGRVFVYTRSADFRAVTDPYYGTSGFGNGGGLMVHGVRSVTGSHPNPLARYLRLLGNSETVDTTFWQHENVRWWYTNVEIADTSFHNVVPTTNNSADSRAFLYELPGANNYAWVASSFGARGDSAAVREILRDSYNPRVFVSVDSAAQINGEKVAPAPALFFPASTITTTVSDFAPGHATIQLSAPAETGNALVISENFYKGWRAYADGKELPVMRAAYNLIGVALPVGARTISVSFADPRYSTGRIITLLALVLTGWVILTGWRRDRQTSVPSAGAYKTTHGGAA